MNNISFQKAQIIKEKLKKLEGIERSLNRSRYSILINNSLLRNPNNKFENVDCFLAPSDNDCEQLIMEAKNAMLKKIKFMKDELNAQFEDL